MPVSGELNVVTKFNKAAEKLKACRLEMCKKESVESERAAEQYKKKIQELMNKALHGKIQKEAFTKQMKSISDAMVNAKPAKQLAACVIKHDKCKQHFIDMYTEILQMLANECKTNKKVCRLYQRGQKLLKQDAIDVDKYIELIKLLRDIANKSKSMY